MSENTKTPRIRFKGFTDAWEQRKLGSEAEELLAGGDIDKDLIGESGSYPVIANALTNDGIVGFYEKYYRVEAPAVTVTGRGDVGHAQARRVNFTPIVRLLSIKSSHNVDFLENAINRGKVIIESTGVPQLTVPQLSKRTISFPQTVQEEEKIGELFFKIDNLITLHQRKCDKLKNIKAALLEKMFPQGDATTPKIRFKGFTDAWEQRKLGDIAKINMGQSPNGTNYTTNPNDAILVQGNADMADGWVLPRVYTKQITKKAHVGDLIFSVRAPVGEVGKTQYNVVIGRGVAAISGNEFIFQSLKRMNIFGYWTKLSAGSTFESINSDTLKAAEFAIPKEDEQVKIGEILLKIDNLITLHQRKVEKLKNIKSALLEKMFV